ncbi:Nucleotide-binding protein, UspA family [Natranaeroarchaeum sulfidigenes]|uniref:Nucleotide-binding protein, UspA family n=2 Tax=Natranaeroarchaeum sulfidigenes TaxID=2784880 RepID=A0A897MQG3_9EURY|nr:Nucleotide-binding protein, UspA family [Natranaeroarchaeum sulfidigenes]
MDDSEMAEKALRYAFDEFPEAEITVLNVVGGPSWMMGEATGLALADDIEEAAAERAEAVFECAHEIATERNRKISTLVGIGHPARNIIDRSEDYDTIILGAHGADRSRVSRRFLVGNVAETVSKRAPIPVIIVR